jgi:hypothetical protein
MDNNSRKECSCLGRAINAIAPVTAKPNRSQGRRDPIIKASWITNAILNMTNDDRTRYFTLMARFNQLGRLLPSKIDLIGSLPKRLSAKLILAEMATVRREMDAIATRAEKRK